MLMKYFCVEAKVERVEIKFLKFEDESRTQREYTTKFNCMARFVPQMVDIEENRIECLCERTSIGTKNACKRKSTGNI